MQLFKLGVNQQNYKWLFLSVIVILILGPRCLCLDADVPAWFSPKDVGIHVDEGYKTFSAKNKVLFGCTNWSPHDDYPGWLKGSPVTQWAYIASFKLLGVGLLAARIVTLIFFSIFLLLFIFFSYRRYGLALMSFAVVLIGLEPMLFQFSRLALFETAIILFIYTGVFFLLFTQQRLLMGLIILCVFAVISAMLIKMSSFIYLALPIFFLSYYVLIRSESSTKMKLLVIGVLLFCFLLIIYNSSNMWLRRIEHYELVNIPKRLFLNALGDVDPIPITASFFCIAHALAFNPRKFFLHSYRIVNTSLIIGTVSLLALFPYAPSRYYVVALPACLLIIIEWIRLKAWQWKYPLSRNYFKMLLFVPVSIVFVFLLLRTINFAFISNIPVNIGDSPGICGATMLKYYLPISLLIPFALYILFRLKREDILIKILLIFLAMVYCINGVYSQGRTLIKPTYNAQRIKQKLIKKLYKDKTFIGNWAPFLTLGTGAKALYMNNVFNKVSRITEIKPNYLLCSNTCYDKESLAYIRANPDVRLSNKITLGSYNNSDIVLYKLTYANNYNTESMQTK